MWRVAGRHSQRRVRFIYMSTDRRVASGGPVRVTASNSSDSCPGLARKAECELSCSHLRPQCPLPQSRVFEPHQQTPESPCVLQIHALLHFTSARNCRSLTDSGSAVGCGAGVGSSTAGRTRQRLGASPSGALAGAQGARGGKEREVGVGPCSAGPVTRLF